LTNKHRKTIVINIKTYEFRLRPNKTQEKQLDVVLTLTRNLYNTGLEELISNYKETGKHLNRFAHDKLHNVQTDPNIYSPLVDTTIARLHNSFANFFRRLKTGEKPGFPRFKSFRQWHSLEFRDGLTNKLEGVYFNSGKKVAGKIRTVVHRPIEGIFKHARIIKRPSGWYVQFVCEVENNILPKTGKQVGIDVGIKYLIADSNGEFVENDKTYRKQLKKLRRSQRVIFRRAKGSNRRLKAARNTARLHERIVSRRKDYLHKVTTNIVNQNDTIVMEDLAIKNMVKNHHLALSITDASWGIIKQMLSYKAENAGRNFVCVSPRFTSQKCSSCGEMVAKALSVRTHLCPYCGFTADRDTNAAKNILRLGRSLQEPNYATA